MNQLIFSLCETPVIGFVMFLSGACAFPNSIDGIDLPLKANSALRTSFTIPAATDYDIEVAIAYGTASVGEVTRLIGEGQPLGCDDQLATQVAALAQQSAQSASTPMEISISGKAHRRDHHFYVGGSCGVAWWTKGALGRRLARVALTPGDDVLDVRSLTTRGLDARMRAQIRVAAKNQK